MNPFFSPRDMVYLPDTTALMVIDTEYNFSYNHQSILSLNPYPTASPYYPRFYISMQCSTLYHSLTPIASYSCMAAAGHNWVKLDLTSSPPPTYTNRCISTFINDFFIIRDSTISHFSGGITQTINMSLKHVENPIEPISIYPRCVPDSLPTHFSYSNYLNVQNDIEKE